MLVRVELELEDWMAKAVIEFAMKLQKNSEMRDAIKKRMAEPEKSTDKAENKSSAEKENGAGNGSSNSTLSKKESNIRNQLLRKAWLLCSKIARLESTPKENITKEMVWDRMKERFGIKSTKDLSDNDLRRFVHQIELYYDELMGKMIDEMIGKTI